MKSTIAMILLAGCFPYSKLPDERAAPNLRKIADAKVLDMKVHLYKQPGLCPGKEGKMYVNANVAWPGSKPVVRTLGSDVDSLQPADFEIRGPLLTGDANAHLHPSDDVLASIERGFDVHVAYKRDAKFAFDLNWAPEYSCYTGWYADGAIGQTGGGGENGAGGDIGQSGTNAGGGGRGATGADGGRVTAYVTVVSTKYYKQLFAVIANDHFFLAPADRPLTFGAAGGQGGTGGQGGSGGNGGDQPWESKDGYDDSGNKTTFKVATGAPGNGGNAGGGGQGGRGGRGGIVDVTYDAAFPQLARMIQTDVRGGAGGYGGGAGYAGSGGGSEAEKGASQGQPGREAEGGGDGNPGDPGRAGVHAGNIAGRFASIRGITRAR